MTELIYIGANHSREIEYDDHTAFVEAPYVVLHSVVSGEYFVADEVVDSSTGSTKTAYTFTFNADTTYKMKPGVYAIEIYEDDSKEDVLYVDSTYGKAVVIASSPKQKQGNTEESSSDSDSSSESN